MNLRPYQQESLDACFEYLHNEKGNQLIVAPTGSGKSLIQAGIVKRGISLFNKCRIMVISHRKEILEQNEAKISLLCPELSVGVFSAGLGQKKIRQVTIAGIQSVARFDFDINTVPDILIIDECHMMPKTGNGLYLKLINLFLSIKPWMRIIGLTASPFRLDSGLLVRGKERIFDAISYEITITELLKLGHLAPLVSKSSIVQADTSNIKKRGGEYIAEAASAVMNDNFLTTQALNEVQQLTQDRESLIFFCTSREHTHNVVGELQKRNIDAHALLGDTPSKERERLIDDFKKKKIRALVSVEVLCLDQETEILTSNGWCKMEEMNFDRLVACWDNGKIFFAPPRSIVKRDRMLHEKMVTLKANAIDIRVTSNHRMVVYNGDSTETKIVPALSLVGKRANIPCHGEAIPSELLLINPITKKKINARIRSLKYVYKNRDGLTDVKARELARVEVERKQSLFPKYAKDLTVSDCLLIGIWIGDGTKSCGRYSVSQSYAYPDNIQLIQKLIDDCGICHSKRNCPPATGTKYESIRWTFARGTGSKDQSRTSGYYKLEPFLDKDGADCLWGLNRDQFLSLIEGFWIADGLHHAKHSRDCITSVNYKLLSTLQAIATCRGIRTTVRKIGNKNNPKHQCQYVFSWSSIKRIKTSKSRFQLEDGYRKEKVWCVTSETGTLVTRRNGKVAVVGNTTGFDAPNVDCVVLLRPTLSTGLYIQMLGRGMRPAPGKQNCLILDYGGNLLRHGPVDDITIESYSKREAEKNKEDLAKACPQCRELLRIQARECTACGYVYPRPELTLTHGIFAEEGSFLSEVNLEKHGAYTKVDVEIWDADLYKTKNGKRALRVKVGNALMCATEYVLFEHGGNVRGLANKKWRMLGGVGDLEDCEQALQQFQTLKRPSVVWIEKTGNYFNVASVNY